MKLLNYTSTYFSALLLAIITIWGVVFYYGMLDEIYDSIDDGLDNQKQLIIYKAGVDSTILNKTDYDESAYSIRPIHPAAAVTFKDVYIDTSMYMINEKDFEPVRMLKTVFLLNEKYYELSVVTSMVEEDDLVAELLWTLVWLYALLVVAILLMNNFLLKRIWRSFYLLLRRMKNFSIDEQKSLPFVKTNVDEFRMLNETVQKMVTVNVEIYNRQKQFIENASHELQTPLAISLNKLEALAENHDLSPKNAELLSGAIESLERLTRLNKSLLLLSRIDKRQYEETSIVKLDDIIVKVMADFDDQLAYKNIDVELEQKGECNVEMNPGLATIMVTNLLKNAIVHNIPGGFIKILVSPISLAIVNTGKPGALNADQIFLRFYKESPSSASTGLGLAIVKAITDLYSYRLSYTYNDQHTFTVSFIK